MMMYDWHFEPDTADIAANNGYKPWIKRRRGLQDGKQGNLAWQALDEAARTNGDDYRDSCNGL